MDDRTRRVATRNPNTVRGRSRSRTLSTLVLSFATLLSVIGISLIFSLVFYCVVCAIAGIVTIAIGALIYLAGFVLYRVDSGKTHFDGYVVQGPGTYFPVQLVSACCPQQMNHPVLNVPSPASVESTEHSDTAMDAFQNINLNGML